MTDVSNTEADKQDEEVPEATPADGTPQETQSKNKRRRKTQSKKQTEGELALFSLYSLHYTS